MILKISLRGILVLFDDKTFKLYEIKNVFDYEKKVRKIMRKEKH